jgi:WD40 repeat protein
MTTLAHPDRSAEARRHEVTALHALPFLTAVLACLAAAQTVFAQYRVDALGDPLPEGAIARLGTTRMRHSHTPDHYCWGLGCIAWSPDGKVIATTSYDGAVGVEARLWEAATGKPLRLLENNKRYGPSFVRFSPDGKTLAAAARDKIILWDVATGKESGRLLGHRDRVDALVFQKGGKNLVSVSRDGAVRWWDIPGRKAVRAWQLLADDPKKTANGEPILLRGISNSHFSADGTTLAVARWRTAKLKKPWGADRASVYDLKARKEIWHDDANDDSYRFAFAPDGKRLAVSRRGIVHIRETPTGRPLTETRWLYPWGMVFSPDGKTVALCVNGKVCFWSPADKTPLREVEVSLHGGGYNTFATDPAFSPDGKKLAIDRRLTFQVLNVATGKPAVHWPSFDEGIRKLAFSADGRLLLGDDLSIDTATWRQRPNYKDPSNRFSHVQSVSSDHTLCVARDGGCPDTLFDIRTGRVVARFKAPARDPGEHKGFFSPRARLYVMQDRSCAGQEVDTVFAIPSGERLFQLSFNRHVGTECWSFSADEARAAFFDLAARKIQVYAARTGKLLWQSVSPNRAGALALSPNGNLLAVWTKGLCDVQIWDLRTGKPIRSLVLRGDAKDRHSARLAWSPDNRMLAVGGLDSSVRLWEVASAQVRREFHGHLAQATCLAFSPDGRFLASASEDTTLLIWKTLFDSKRRGPLTEDEFLKLWGRLKADAGTAYEVQAELRYAPQSAAAFLARRLQPAPAADAPRVAALIKSLESKAYRVRAWAARQLERLGDLARGPIRKALAAGPPLETRRRLEGLLGKMTRATPSQLRSLRAIEILEGVGNAEAMKTLERLAQGNPDSLVTAESRTVVARMKKKK